jgi:hypothetical protein
MIQAITIALLLSLAAPVVEEQTPKQPAGPPSPLVVDGDGQQRPQPGKPGVRGGQEAKPPAPPGGQPQPGPPAPPRRRGKDLNIQIELTISDQSGSAAPEKRTVSMIVADASFGRIRSNQFNGAAGLNVDARTELLESERILVELTVEYKALPPDGVPPTKRPADMNEMLTIILQNGKPQVISQASDPVSDRKMTLEIRATVIK